MTEIPLRRNPNQKLKIILEGQECTIHVQQRGSRLYMNLFVGADAVTSGAICQDHTRIVQNAQRLFTGNLVFFDTLGTTAPHWQGLGTRYVLIYFGENDSMQAYRPE